ncbi:thioredoxin [Neobacillus notoginsengisoli]|uniref:Thioredoxin n=1 Tax=Neobacillus notoginsengisoli TaxID=1578198 RepID=A0A417YY67_9BACI|nr:thioredoxin family protein [Neobacillus notoginsengisoli]RHW42671.1 thioredoxin [Neobacillus notoginsengisoli]
MKEWTSEELSAFLTSGKTGLAYFYTPLCGTCQVAGRMLEVIDALQPDLEIGKINLNYAPEFALTFGIESVPCLAFVKEGRAVDAIYAFRSVPYLLDKINTVFD